MPDQALIVISRNSSGVVQFTPAGTTLTQLVFWRNDDPQQSHWPQFTDANISLPNPIASAETSNPVMPGRTLADVGVTLAQGAVATVNYTCQQHPGESGSIQVVNDFIIPSIQIPPPPATAKVGTPLGTLQLTTGGMPPITSKLTAGAPPAGLTLNISDPINGASLSGTPTQAGTTTFSLHTQDNLGNSFDSTFVVTITA